MARARNIKPGFFTNDALAEAQPLARILFAGLWCFADRKGRMHDRPKKIKAEILPYDDCNVDELIESLAVLGFVLRYEVSGSKYIQVINFEKHQNPHVQEQASEIPAPDLHQTSTGLAPDNTDECMEVAGLIPSSLIPDSLNPISPIVVSELTPCPHSEIIALYAEHLPALPQVRKWEGTRQKHLKSRWLWVLKDLESKGKPFDKAAGLNFFCRMFAYIAKSDFLMGKTTDWSCPGLPWIVNDENFTKIIEGNYENKQAAA